MAISTDIGIPSYPWKPGFNDQMQVSRGISDESEARKQAPVFSGVLAYFPDALFEVAKLSKAGNDKHNADQPLHWSKDKSSDHDDCIARHLLDKAAGVTYDPVNKCSPSVAIAWRALAALQVEIENARVR